MSRRKNKMLCHVPALPHTAIESARIEDEGIRAAWHGPIKGSGASTTSSSCSCRALF